ncbi:nuclease [Coemansia sp. RSA 1290]|nr:nuclease [Coemansia sp. RSA 1290]
MHEWEELKRLSLLSAGNLRTLAYTAKLPLASLRWRLFLGVLPVELFGQDDAECQQVWQLAADRERQSYQALKARFIVDPTCVAKEETDWKRMNPLSLDRDSPWHQYHQDQHLRNTILQDVSRTFPEEPYFRHSRVQRLMADMLFVYAKVHSSLQYRQGMHELLAPLLLAVDRDAVARTSEFPTGLLDCSFVEHDTFALFDRLMRLCMPWYQVPPALSPRASDAQTPIVAQCQLLMDKLAALDPELSAHLRQMDIEPQLFGIRWYRLLFSRELPRLRDVLALWDALFADNVSGTLRLVDWIGLVFLLANRRRLLQGDYEDTLTTLLHLPPLPRPSPDALEQTAPLPSSPQSPNVTAFPTIDLPVAAPKIPFQSVSQPGLRPIQRLALQAAYLRAHPSHGAAMLVAGQYRVWEQEAWDVIEDLDTPAVESSTASDSPKPQPAGPLPPLPQARKMYTSSTLQQKRNCTASANYTVTSYNRALRNPNWVAEHLTRENLQGTADRADSEFHEDPDIPSSFRALLKDYYRSGYDRGHMCPAADAKKDTQAMNETFFLTNIAPQVGKGFNRNYWASLETFVRDLTKSFDDVYCISGPLYLPQKEGDKWMVRYEVIGNPPNVAVPTHFFKVILAKRKNESGFAIGAFALPNKEIDNSVPLTNFSFPLEYVEKAAGLKFFDQVERKAGVVAPLCSKIQCTLDHDAWKKKRQQK